MVCPSASEALLIWLVNADNELSLGIIWKIKLDLLALVSVWRIEPGAISRLFIEPLAESERAMANRDEGLSRFDGQKLRDDICRFAVGHQTAEASRQLHQFRRRLVGAKIPQDCGGVAEIRHAALAIQDAWITNLDAAKHRSDLSLAVVLDAPKALAIHAKSKT